MKKIYLLLIFLGVADFSFGQLNYFFTPYSKPYVPVENGNVPTLKSTYELWEVEDEGFARVPIRFSFKYDGESYDHANIHVNGFITFRDSLDINFNYRYFRNLLKHLPPYKKRPIIAAFWDDLLMLDDQSMVYKTTGRAPFRVFTVEWKKVKWVYESPDPVLSLQLRLYETTNIIEFHYKDEGGMPDPRYNYASIGITSSYTNRGFISVLNTSAKPPISFLASNDSIRVKPQDNQVYRFTPSLIRIPDALSQSLSYTHNTASFKIGKPGFNICEYAITRSPIPPVFGKKTFSGNINISSLNPETTYYIYARNTALFGLLYSQWTCDSFTTASRPVSVPYIPTMEGVEYPPQIPFDWRVQNFSDTSSHFVPGDDWYAETGFIDEEAITFMDLQNMMFDANSWLFTRGIKLARGKTYQLNFEYYSYPMKTDDDVSALEVKYGTAAGEAGMTHGPLFKDLAISASEFIDMSETGVRRDTTIEIIPKASGTYYFGFHNTSVYNQGLLIIHNISLTEASNVRTGSLVLNGKLESKNNLLTWRTSYTTRGGQIEVERSRNGVDFEKIGVVAESESGKRTSISPLKIRMHAGDHSLSKTQPANKHSEPFDLRLTFPGTMPINEVRTIARETFRSLAANHKSKDALSFKDERIDIGPTWYRVRLTVNGKSVYSNAVKLERMLMVDALYPNPANELVSLRIRSASMSRNHVTVTDISGRVLFSKEISLAPGTNVVQVPVHNLATNTYFINVTDDEKRPLFSERFVKR